MSGWSEQELETLKSLVENGVTVPVIAAKLKKTINAVRGKAHRLKLSLPRTAHGVRNKNAPKKKLSVEQQMVLREFERMEYINWLGRPTKIVKLIDLGPSMCHWTHGDPATEKFTYCGHKTDNDATYCNKHLKTMKVGFTRC